MNRSQTPSLLERHNSATPTDLYFPVSSLSNAFIIIRCILICFIIYNKYLFKPQTHPLYHRRAAHLEGPHIGQLKDAALLHLLQGCRHHRGQLDRRCQYRQPGQRAPPLVPRAALCVDGDPESAAPRGSGRKTPSDSRKPDPPHRPAAPARAGGRREAFQAAGGAGLPPPHPSRGRRQRRGSGGAAFLRAPR